MNTYELKRTIELLIDTHAKMLTADRDSICEYRLKEMNEQVLKLQHTLEAEQEKTTFLLAKIDRIAAEVDNAIVSDYSVRVNISGIIKEITL